MEFHQDLVKSSDYRTFCESKKFKAECLHFSMIKLSLLTVLGVVMAPNPGADPRLERANPGFNPMILRLNLVFDQEPGKWIQLETAKSVGFAMALQDCDDYDQVEIVGVETIDITKTKA